MVRIRANAANLLMLSVLTENAPRVTKEYIQKGIWPFTLSGQW